MDEPNFKDRITVYRILVGYLLAILLIISLGSDSSLVDLNTPYTLDTLTQMIAGTGSLLLSFALVWHYRKQTKVQKEQTKIQANQEQIMEMQYRPRVSPGITLEENHIPKLMIKNIGAGEAMRVDVDWELAGEQRSWTTPFLPAGENVSFPLLEKIDSKDRIYTCNTEDIKRIVDESDDLIVKIKYQNIRHEGRDSEYTISVLERLERLEKSASGKYLV